jgi:hypothetical protein
MQASPQIVKTAAARHTRISRQRNRGLMIRRPKYVCRDRAGTLVQAPAALAADVIHRQVLRSFTVTDRTRKMNTFDVEIYLEDILTGFPFRSFRQIARARSVLETKRRTAKLKGRVNNVCSALARRMPSVRSITSCSDIQR